MSKEPHTNEENPIPDSTVYTYTNKYVYVYIYIYIVYVITYIYTYLIVLSEQGNGLL